MGKIFNLGMEHSSDIFILGTSIYRRTIHYTQEFIEHPGGATSSITRSVDSYHTYNFETQQKGILTSKEFYDNLAFFRHMKETQSETYYNQIYQFILDNDLYQYAAESDLIL